MCYSVISVLVSYQCIRQSSVVLVSVLDSVLDGVLVSLLVSVLVSAIAQCNSSGVSSVCRSMKDVSVFVQCESSVY